MSLQIRPAFPYDAEALAIVMQEANVYKQSHSDMSWSNYPFTADETTEMIKTGYTHVGLIGGEVVAGVMLPDSDSNVWGLDDGRALYIHRLAVRNEFRGMGVGRHILHWADDQARERSRAFMRLDCWERNTSLCDYYRNLGFVVVRTSPSPKGPLRALFQKTL